MGKHRLFDLAESPIHDTPKNKEQAGESKMLKSDRRGNREKNTALLFAISSYFIGCYKMRTAIESYLRLWLEHILHVCTAENVLFHLKTYIYTVQAIYSQRSDFVGGHSWDIRGPDADDGLLGAAAC